MNKFESSVNSYDSQTTAAELEESLGFESSVNSYDSQTDMLPTPTMRSLRVV